MTTLREAAEHARRLLSEDIDHPAFRYEARECAAALRDALAQEEKFCDSHCVWTDHHPDCKLAQQEPNTGDDLPPPPEPYMTHGFHAVFTADQMREYARAAVLAEREACAKVCEAKAQEWRQRSVPLLGYSGELDDCAAAIRARGQE